MKSKVKSLIALGQYGGFSDGTARIDNTINITALMMPWITWLHAAAARVRYWN